MFQRLTDIGNEAVDLLGLLLPLPEFPDGAIKLTHPYHFAETVSVKTIWQGENGDILFHWWGEENGIGKLERYPSEDCFVSSAVLAEKSVYSIAVSEFITKFA